MVNLMGYNGSFRVSFICPILTPGGNIVGQRCTFWNFLKTIPTKIVFILQDEDLIWNLQIPNKCKIPNKSIQLYIQGLGKWPLGGPTTGFIKKILLLVTHAQILWGFILRDTDWPGTSKKERGQKLLCTPGQCRESCVGLRSLPWGEINLQLGATHQISSLGLHAYASNPWGACRSSKGQCGANSSGKDLDAELQEDKSGVDQTEALPWGDKGHPCRNQGTRDSARTSVPLPYQKRQVA